MKLGDLVPAGTTLSAAAAAKDVTGFAIDHRKVAPGTVFGAFAGATVDGEDFIPAAIERGAIAVVARSEATVVGAVHFAADEPRRVFARIAAPFFAPYPATTVAVTGTNGKTSTVELTRQLWRLAGHRAASIGTLGVTTADDQVSTGLTTPDIVTFLANMGGLAREGLSHVAFEASSHGLAQYRTEGLPVRAAAFTNLSRDHLDYHGTMAAYFAAKLRLFTDVVDADGTAVVWDDGSEWAGAVISATAERGVKTIVVRDDAAVAAAHGANAQAAEPAALIRRIAVVTRSAAPLGQTLELRFDGETHRVDLPLIGAYQAANALTAAALVIATGGDAATTFANLSRLQPVRGRLERAAIARSGAAVYVDYAHTPDALQAACDSVRPHVTGRLLLVFGAGGDRDAGKRPLMGAVAVAAADNVIVTDDNPRSEGAAAIRAAILAAAPGATEIDDRRTAIATAIRASRPGDIVLIAGKGHEQGQIVGDRVLPFDDVVVAREVAEESAREVAENSAREVAEQRGETA